MSDMLMHYGLFLAQTVTIVLAIVVTAGGVAVVVALAARKDEGERLEVRRLNERLERMSAELRSEILPKKQAKAERKAAKKARKARAEEESESRRLYVLDFHGDLKASGVPALREEVSAVLAVARPEDEVVVRLENSGGLVHEHGLAASQLLRIRARGIPLTVIVDKVAASGGYMMACTANRILAAPFAILGSIGVLLQLPNFHRLLESHGIDFEQIKGGEYKRTLTVFGNNTEADRAKSREEVEHTHALFKAFVTEQRPALDLDQVATGEHWYGTQALALGLCDELSTSDEYLGAACGDADVFLVSFKRKQTIGQRLGAAVRTVTARVAGRVWQHEHEKRLGEG